MRTQITLFLILLGIRFAQAQGPSPCGTPALMTPSCEEACVICDINGFQGRNSSPTTGTVPPGFCTMNVQNAQWIAFIAGSTNLTIQIQVTNCQQGQGLQIGLYKGDDCTNFARISNCINGLDQGQTGTFVSNQPLLIGQYYWLIIDGQDGDVCDYKVTVTSGSTLVNELTDSGSISGPDVICVNEVSSYKLTPPVGAADFLWQLNGQPIGALDSLALSIPTPGQYNLCATSFNACDEAPPVCKSIIVVSPAQTTRDTFFCETRCITLEDSSICDPGTYTFTLKTVFGCDSVVRYNLQEVDAVLTPVQVNICDGDTLYVGPYPFTETGFFTTVLPTTIDCDSTIQLDLTVVICQIDAASVEVPVRCNGANDGILLFKVDNGTPPFTYNWSRLGSNPPITGSGNLSTLGQSASIPNLRPGLYSVTIADQFGNFAYLLQDVTEPDSIQLALTTSNYNGFGVSCPQSADGSISLQASGGVGALQAAWSTGSNAIGGLSALSVGTYTVTVTDANSCTATAQIDLTAPTPLVIDVAFNQPNCDGYTSGSIQINSATGGIPPYRYFIKSDTLQTMVFDSLEAGNYSASVIDQNGCITSQIGSLAEPPIPQVFLPDTATIALGDSTRIAAIFNQYAQTLAWTPFTGLSCPNCDATYARPGTTTMYTLNATSAAGCTSSDSILVTVLPIYDVYVPNVFQPDLSGDNTRFNIFAGPEVVEIERFEVFSRWGELIYTLSNIQPNDPSLGWDGSFRGRQMPTGVYAWYASILFLDGKTEVYRGDVSLLR